MRRFPGTVISISSEETADEKKESVGGAVEFRHSNGPPNTILCSASLTDFDVFCGSKAL